MDDTEKSIGNNQIFTNPIGKNLTPLAIILSGLFIAGAIVFVGLNDESLVNGSLNDVAKPKNYEKTKISILSKFDETSDSFDPQKEHILGSINAPIKIIEFSDTECPFCKRFHASMQTIMAEYGVKGKVAWIYKHFPLDEIHPRAPKEAEATECANELGGNAKFWAYLDKIFEVTPSNNGLNPDELPKIAQSIGLDVEQFESCLESGRHKDEIALHVDEAESEGATGTPYSILIDPKGDKFYIRGAVPYDALKKAIDDALSIQA